MPLREVPGGVELGVTVDTVRTKEKVVLIANLALHSLRDDEITAAWDEINSLHTLGIFDPTAYMRSMGNIDGVTKLLGAVSALRKVAKEVLGE